MGGGGGGEVLVTLKLRDDDAVFKPNKNRTSFCTAYSSNSCTLDSCGVNSDIGTASCSPCPCKLGFVLQSNISKGHFS